LNPAFPAHLSQHPGGFVVIARENDLADPAAG